MRLVPLLGLLLLLALPALAQETYTNPIIAPQAHDPALIRTDDGTYYVYSPEDTWGDGQGQRYVPTYKSRDLVDWVYVGDAFAGPPAWKADGDYWAVGVYERGGTYYMYYSIWDFRFIYDPDPCIGLATAPSPEGPWAELGRPVLCSVEAGAPSSIDPFVWDDGETQTLIWGTLPSIYAAELSADGTEIVTEPLIIARDVEGAYVTQRDGYYYLWGSSGTCCFGIFSSYQTRVGRSTSLLGPYLNRNGQNLRNALGAVVVEGDPIFPGPWVWVGPGHNAVAVDDAGADWLLYHAIPTANPGPPGGIGGTTREILMDRILWVDGWPRVNGRTPSSTPQAAPTVDLDARVVLQPTTSTKLPPSGGQVAVALHVENTAAETQTLDVWLDARLPDGRYTAPLLGPLAVTLAPGETYERTLGQRLGAAAPGGTYWVQAYAGSYPAGAEDYGAFPLLKRGASGSRTLADGSVGSAVEVSVLSEAPAPAAPIVRAEPAETTELAVLQSADGAPRILLTLAEAQAVRVEVFDLLGRRVAPVHDGVAEGGAHTWPVQTGRLASGTYLVRAVVGSDGAAPRVLTQKLTVVR